MEVEEALESITAQSDGRCSKQGARTARREKGEKVRPTKNFVEAVFRVVSSRGIFSPIFSSRRRPGHATGTLSATGEQRPPREAGTLAASTAVQQTVAAIGKRMNRAQQTHAAGTGALVQQAQQLPQLGQLGQQAQLVQRVQ